MKETVSVLLKKMSPNVQLWLLIFGMGASWARMEFKSEKDKLEIMSVFTEHAAESRGTHKTFEIHLVELNKDIENAVRDIYDLQAFLRPDDIRMRGRRR